MRGFILGVIVTLVVLFGVGLAIADLGFLPTSADATPPAFETRMAGSALDASMDRHAPRVNNPVPITDETRTRLILAASGKLADAFTFDFSRIRKKVR